MLFLFVDVDDVLIVNPYNEDPYAKEFGVTFENRLTIIKGRVLPPPMLKFGDQGKEKVFWPKVGKWNMQFKRRFVSRMNAKAAAVLLLVLLVSHASSAECREVRGSGGRRLDFEIRSRGGAGKLWVAAGLPGQLPLIPIVDALKVLRHSDRAM
ncbi:hypothetical protein ZWY2020_014374 [Hordeum vulgare]|nr:hypothetical protein ZWY2020_014374 [Hordeum vulgare]